MKIAVLVSRFPHPYQTFIRREIAEVARQGAEVTVFPIVTPSRRDNGADRPPPGVRVVYTGLFSPRTFGSCLSSFVRHPRLCLSQSWAVLAGTWRHPADFAKSLVALVKASAIARRIRKEGFDHIHAHWATHPTTAAWAVSRLTGVPFSFAFHAYDIFASRVLLPQKLASASFVVVNCRYTWDFVRRLYPHVPDARYRLVYNGLELDRFAPLARTPRQEPPLILAVGQLVPTKGFADLIEACRRLRDSGRAFSALLIGEGPQRDDLEAAIRANGLTDVVRLAGRRSEEDVRESLSRAAVLVMPSTTPKTGSHDGLPNVVIEAQAAGVPVVGTRVFGIPELVEDGVSGFLVPERDPTALADAVGKLLADPALARRFGAAGIEKTRALFDVRRNVQSLISFYAEARTERQNKTADRASGADGVRRPS